MECVKYIFNLT